LIHILHLEDDPADAEIVQAMLAKAGLACRITQVQTRGEFETALCDGGTAIILADYRLPTYDGMSALRLSRELRSDIPFIFVSGAMGEEAAIAALTQGATDYVLKRNLSRLAPAVRRALEEARNRRERRQAEEALQRSNMINAARLYLMQFAVGHGLDELLEETLNEAEKLTDSRIGFYHFVDDDQQSLTLQNWSTQTKTKFCRAQGKGLHYPITDAGVWVDCVREGKPVMHNDYASLTHRKGMPAGHAEVVRELVVPVMRGGKIKAILGVGNKPADYSQKDVEAMSLLADLVWETATSKRAEEALRRSEEKHRSILEKRVAERTLELENRAQQLQQLALELSGAEDRERRHIASILHDDFQQQLAYIKMELDLLQKNTDQNIEQKLGRLSRLTGECIEKSRNLSYEINPPVLHRSGLLAAIDALAKDYARNHGLAITVRTQPDAEPTSFSLASILYRSVRELLFNVVKHAGVNAALIDVQSNKRCICIRVEDNGNGFDFDAVRAGQGRGIGFGLYNIEDRMASLGGSMEVNTEPGKGCRVLLTVPKKVSRKTTLPKVPLAPSGRKGVVSEMPDKPIQPFDNTEQIRILLADDHKLLREALAKLLEDSPDLTVVGQAVDGREVVQLAATLRPHVILMDVTMPELDGFEATAQINRMYPDIRIIGLSMHNDTDTRQKMLNAGASAYLTKTGSPDALIGTIRRLHHG
jgi:signal transduction histidine kinase/DNA-binding NarL/FixJ family response regulator